MICTYCGQLGHRASRCPRRGVRTAFAAVALALIFGGCAGQPVTWQPSFTLAPDTLCRTARPSYASNDTWTTRERQRLAAVHWDARCTLLGAWRK